MKYVHVQWITSREDVATSLFYEVGDDGLETRKIEIYPNGSSEIAGDGFESTRTWLSHKIFPSIDEINKDKQFAAKEVIKEEFEAKRSEPAEAESRIAELRITDDRSRAVLDIDKRLDAAMSELR
ncbi:MAG: hypothetical protein E5X51_03825 [Mesorhizobium sp.]|uniref:DUF6881 domain-containing protein n=1 Tax=Mesorhizobium sp. TaxID=1871066 RepID=UPI0011FD6983|nr:hypothetical protein [Mesorhizobium sp.]TIQ22806.1 MAG: hypothetical protein E5X51_03825 [Mesorhizobium sp.]